MTQKAAICLSLLRGETLTIMNGFKLFYCSNIPREVSRSVEKPFGIIVTRTRKDFTSVYGQHGFYYEYKLNKTGNNSEGIEKMKIYCREQLTAEIPKTDKQKRVFKQTELMLS